MTPRRPLLLIAAVLAGAATVVPVAGAGSGDVQAIRAVAVRYTQATTTGDPVACQLLTPNGRASFVYRASKLTKTKLTSCPAAVTAVAKLNASLTSSATYASAHAAELRALAEGKVTVHGARATLDYTEATGIGSVSSSMDFALVQGRWLVDI